MPLPPGGVGDTTDLESIIARAQRRKAMARGGTIPGLGDPYGQSVPIPEPGMMDLAGGSMPPPPMGPASPGSGFQTLAPSLQQMSVPRQFSPDTIPGDFGGAPNVGPTPTDMPPPPPPGPGTGLGFAGMMPPGAGQEAIDKTMRVDAGRRSAQNLGLGMLAGGVTGGALLPSVGPALAGFAGGGVEGLTRSTADAATGTGSPWDIPGAVMGDAAAGFALGGLGGLGARGLQWLRSPVDEGAEMASLGQALDSAQGPSVPAQSTMPPPPPMRSPDEIFSEAALSTRDRIAAERGARLGGPAEGPPVEPFEFKQGPPAHPYDTLMSKSPTDSGLPALPLASTRRASPDAADAFMSRLPDDVPEPPVEPFEFKQTGPIEGLYGKRGSGTTKRVASNYPEEFTPAPPKPRTVSPTRYGMPTGHNRLNMDAEDALSRMDLDALELPEGRALQKEAAKSSPTRVGKKGEEPARMSMRTKGGAETEVEIPWSTEGFHNNFKRYRKKNPLQSLPKDVQFPPAGPMSEAASAGPPPPPSAAQNWAREAGDFLKKPKAQTPRPAAEPQEEVLRMGGYWAGTRSKLEESLAHYTAEAGKLRAKMQRARAPDQIDHLHRLLKEEEKKISNIKRTLGMDDPLPGDRPGVDKGATSPGTPSRQPKPSSAPPPWKPDPKVRYVEPQPIGPEWEDGGVSPDRKIPMQFEETVGPPPVDGPTGTEDTLVRALDEAANDGDARASYLLRALLGSAAAGMVAGVAGDSPRPAQSLPRPTATPVPDEQNVEGIPLLEPVATYGVDEWSKTSTTPRGSTSTTTQPKVKRGRGKRRRGRS